MILRTSNLTGGAGAGSVTVGTITKPAASARGACASYIICAATWWNTSAKEAKTMMCDIIALEPIDDAMDAINNSARYCQIYSTVSGCETSGSNVSAWDPPPKKMYKYNRDKCPYEYASLSKRSFAFITLNDITKTCINIENHRYVIVKIS